MTANTIGLTGLGHSRLPARLASLTQLTNIAAGRTGSEGFSQELLTDWPGLFAAAGFQLGAVHHDAIVKGDCVAISRARDSQRDGRKSE